MIYIGDVHAYFTPYKNIIKSHRETIQVGDFGHGFAHVPEFPANHQHIRGNHDNPEAASIHPNYIPDGTIKDGRFFLGGALSIDQYHRTEGVSWWRDEELTIDQLHKMINLYSSNRDKFHTVVTHDCPAMVSSEIFGYYGEQKRESRTGQALQAMFSIYQPKQWIFGHYHMQKDQVISGTRFVCLAELEAKELD